MAYNYEYPYTDPNRYNSDWLINAMRKLQEEWNIFVPTHEVKFGGIWDGTKTYGAYTIVSDNGLNSYISRVAVPAGIQITDENYWLLIGTYNAQISVEIARAVEEIKRHDMERNVIFISDSYGTFTNNDNERWYDVCARLANITTRYATVSGGAGFTKQGNINFKNMLVERANSITDKTSITHVVVGGGINDHLATSEEILNAIADFVNTSKALLPNAKVYIANIGLTFDAAVHNDEMARNIYAYRNCSKAGACYLANTEYIMTNRALFGSDWVHPNVDGVNAIGAAMAEAFMIGSCTVNYEITPEITVGAFGGTVTAPTVKMCRINDTIKIVGGNLSEPVIMLTLDFESKNLNPSAMGTVCKLSNSITIGGNYEKIPCGVRLTDSNGAVSVISGYLRGYTNNGVPYLSLETYDNQRKYGIIKLEVIV